MHSALAPTETPIPGTAKGAALSRDALRQLALQCGADDAGLVSIDRPELDSEREHILRFYPRTKTLLSFVCRMNREPIRNPARSVANVEAHQSGDHVNEVAHRIVAALEQKGVRAINPPMAFPMEAENWPERMWVVSHKPLAEAAGLGVMGIHRNVIHPQFGNFILLGTVLIDAPVTEEHHPLDFNPCLSCKLCVAACPVGAIGADGAFNFSSCYHHNYREFMGGFGDWVEQIADSRDGLDYRRRVKPAESVSVWQSLAFGPNYKAAYCMAVCPAGSDVISDFQQNKGAFIRELVKPLQEKEEPIYVIPGSDADAHVTKRFPHKTKRFIRGSLLPRRIAGFLRGIQLTFQAGAAGELNATYHFLFTGRETAHATVTIRAGKITVSDGLEGEPQLRVTADSATWLGFLAKEKSLVWALLTGRIRLRGNPKWLVAFGRCFPS